MSLSLNSASGNLASRSCLEPFAVDPAVDFLIAEIAAAIAYKKLGDVGNACAHTDFGDFLIGPGREWYPEENVVRSIQD